MEHGKEVRMITGIGHIAFRVTDLARSLDFYCDKLGFEEAFRLDAEGQPKPWIVYLRVAPGVFVELFPGAAQVGPQPGADPAITTSACMSMIWTSRFGNWPIEACPSKADPR
jgi:lactoylglutathione lyase